MLQRALPLAAVLVCSWNAAAAAQVISIRTVPISQSHQFDLFPSRSLAMGGVTIAVDDSLSDPFSNPAKGFRLAVSRFFGAPGVYRVSQGAGAGRTLPVGALFRSGPWFGAGALALQQVDLSEPMALALQVPISCRACLDQATVLPTTQGSNGNTFAHAMVGRTVSPGFSIGGSLSWSGLHGVDGVDLLYAGSSRLVQRGHALDVRLGLHKQWTDDRALSALVLHDRYASTHDVYYLDSFWDPGSQQFDQRSRLEENLDHTNTWGLHLQYTQALRAPGWRVGVTATTNLASHPKIPNYEIQNIPRDPGNSEAFNVGVGLARTVDASTVAIDLVYEPIWSHTWADAAGPVETALGTTIPAGGKTIENRFRFSNAILRMGLSQDIELDRSTKAMSLQLGLSVHRIDYSLAQRNHVTATSRQLDEDWVEWSPTWGVSFRFPAWEVRYRGSATNGTGRPGVFSGNFATVDAAPRNILVAPSGPISFGNVRVMTHQVSISFPFR